MCACVWVAKPFFWIKENTQNSEERISVDRIKKKLVFSIKKKRIKRAKQSMIKICDEKKVEKKNGN